MDSEDIPRKSARVAEADLTVGSMEDTTTIEAFGYEQAYRRGLRTVANACMVISLTSPLSAIAITGFYSLKYGGYWGLSCPSSREDSADFLRGWILPSIIYFPQTLAIAELCSSMPVNGAFFWWSAALAPPKWSRIISFITGWINIFSMFTGTAAFAYACASSLAYSINIIVPGFTFTNAQLMGMSMAVFMVWFALMLLKVETIGWTYVVIAAAMFLHLAVFVFALPISHATQNIPFASGADVFGKFTNFTDWPASVAVPYTWFCAVWVNSAWMCPAYVMEETRNSRISTPRSMIFSYLTTSISGVIVCLLYAFCITDIDAAGTDPSGYPLFDVIIEHWGVNLSAAFFLFLAPFGIAGGSGTIVTYASQFAAFARDGGLPFKDNLTHVHARINLPIYSVFALGIGSFMILLLALSSAASSIIYSLSVFSGVFTYTVPVALRIFSGDRWVPGPWNLGRWSMPTHVFTLLSQIYLLTMESFPPYKAWTWDTMNYSWALTLLCVLISLVMYTFAGKSYVGVNQAALTTWREREAVKIITKNSDTRDNF